MHSRMLMHKMLEPARCVGKEGTAIVEPWWHA
jgi:hypothetical protein